MRSLQPESASATCHNEAQFSRRLTVRWLLMPSIATLLGRWFWWPQVVYPRGDYHRRQPPTHDTHTDDTDTDALALPTHR
jgi:hypothetical protein